MNYCLEKIMRFRLILVFLLFCTLLSVFPVEMPEFGPSVAFDKNDPPVTVESLKGKVVLVVFFQEW